MGKIVVVGGSMSGLLTAMTLADDGHQVEVLERDPSPPVEPKAAWDDWDRSTVRQFRLAHFFLPPFNQALTANLPRVVAALDAGGALRMNPISVMPQEMSGGWRHGDERFEALTGSRPMVEAAVARCAAETDGVTIRRGVVVTGLSAEEGRGPVHVTGVETADGERFEADLVVDATGRNTSLPRFLAAVGARSPVDESDESGFVYYGRAFRSTTGELPPAFGGGLQHYGSISTLTLGADNGTWALALVASGRDKAMRRVRQVEVFDEVWRAHPLVAHWLDGEPISDGVAVMGNLEDRIRHFVVDGKPVATGVVTVGDSWACTNPSVGRGVSLAVLQVIGLRDLLRVQDLGDAIPFVMAWDQWTAENVEPFYRETVRGDRHRQAQIEAVLDGEHYETADPILAALDGLEEVAYLDPDLLRVWLDAFMMNQPAAKLLAEPELRDEIKGLRGGGEPAPGPTREELEAMLVER